MSRLFLNYLVKIVRGHKGLKKTKIKKGFTEKGVEFTIDAKK
jgi:hypothetical protein